MKPLTPQQQNNKESTKVGRYTKRSNVLKPESEPTFFDQQRELEDLWKQVLPVGAEDQFDLLSEYKWNLSNVQEFVMHLMRGGVLHGKKHNCSFLVIHLTYMGSSVERLKSQIFTLSRVQRRFHVLVKKALSVRCPLENEHFRGLHYKRYSHLDWQASLLELLTSVEPMVFNRNILT